MRLMNWVVVAAVVTTSASTLQAANNVTLIDAVKQGNREVVRSLMARRADVNVKELDGTTALHWAVRADDTETVSLLIKAGANVSAANRYGITPLWQAAMNGNGTIIELLLSGGANPNWALSSGETALLVAAQSGKVDAVKTLVAHGADVNAKENVFGQTALMLAAGENHPEVIKLLVEAGADVNARSAPNTPKSFALSNPYKGAFTPLLFAARHGSIDSGRTLIAAGADKNERDPDGITPLQLAIFNGHYDFAAMMVESGADVNLADEAGRTPLYQAIDMRRLEFVAGRPDPKWTDTLDELAVIRLLLEKGADVNATLKKRQPARKGGSPTDAWLIEGTTPFLKAAKNGDVPVLKLLLEHKANPYAIAPKIQANALMFAAGVGWRELSSIAAEKDSLEAVKMLWELGGFDINAAVLDAGQTALHGAASRGATSIIQFLVDHGADLYATDKRGMTPLDEAGPVAEGRGGSSIGDKHQARPAAQALLRTLMDANPPKSAASKP